jgi:hypothetical protein
MMREILEQPRADRRELGAPRAALNELDSELRFHGLDAAGERGLSDAQGFGGRPNAALVGNFHELPQMLEVKMA